LAYHHFLQTRVRRRPRRSLIFLHSCGVLSARHHPRHLAFCRTLSSSQAARFHPTTRLCFWCVVIFGRFCFRQTSSFLNRLRVLVMYSVVRDTACLCFRMGAHFSSNLTRLTACHRFHQ
jgi:hypothetical protein